MRVNVEMPLGRRFGTPNRTRWRRDWVWMIVLGMVWHGVGRVPVHALPATNAATRVQRSLAAGLNYTMGNSRSVLTTLRANLKGETERLIYRMTARMSYGKTSQENDQGRDQMILSSQSVDFNGELRRLLNDRDYWQAKSTFQHNKVAGLDYRIEAGPSLGRYFLRRPDHEFSSDLGVAQLREAKNGEETEDRPALRWGARWERKLESEATLLISGEWMPALDDFGDRLFNGEAAAETPLTARLKIRVQVTDTYDSRPAEGKVRHDATVATLLTVKF